MLLLCYGRGHWTAAGNIETLVESLPGGLATYRPRLTKGAETEALAEVGEEVREWTVICDSGEALLAERCMRLT